MTPKIAVLGGRQLASRQDSLIAYALGDVIAARGYQLFTGGVSGAGEEASRGAYRHLQQMGENPVDRITSVVPHGYDSFHPYGRTLHRGKDWEERRRELVKIADIFIVIGGGEGTRQEISFAVEEGKPLIPIACTGGEAARLWQKLYESEKSPVGRDHLWKLRPEVNDPLFIKKEVMGILSLLMAKRE